MESNVEDQTTTPAAEESAPPRRRASRRVSTAAGATSEATAAAAAPAVDAPAPAAEPAAETAAPAEAETAPKKRATRARKKPVEADAAEAEAPAAAPEAETAPAKTSARTSKAAAAKAAKAVEADEADATATDTAQADASATDAAAEAAPKKRATRSRKKPVEAEAEAAEPAATEGAAPAASDEPQAADDATQAPAKRTRSRRVKTDEAAPAESAAVEAPAAEQPEPAATNEAADAAPAQDGEAAETERGGRGRRGRGRGQKPADAQDAEQSDSADGEEPAKGGRGQNQNGQNQNQNGERGRQNGQNQNGQNGQNQNGDRGRQGQNGPESDKNADASGRSSRTRQRDRKRRGTGDDFEPEITEDDVLLPIAGILDVLDNYAFVRTSGYLPGTSDVYVSLGQVKKYGLRRGDAVVGAIRQPREGESGSRQKYNAIVKIDSINGRAFEESEERADASEFTPIYPDTRLRFEGTRAPMLGRAIDIAAPIGLGQRALVVLPGHTPGAPVLADLADAVRENAPEAHLMLVLAEAQPEDVTHLQRTVRGEVVAASFDRPAEDQATVAELAIERAKRMLELGHDVVVLVDSLNRFARAYAQAQHAPARPQHDEIDEFALGQIKKLLAAARNVENGGSLTVLATVEHGTGLASDKVLLREARRVSNSEIRIAKGRAGVAPEVDLAKSHTLTVPTLLSADEVSALDLIRGALHDEDGAKRVTQRIRESASNAALLAEVQRAGRVS